MTVGITEGPTPAGGVAVRAFYCDRETREKAAAKRAGVPWAGQRTLRHTAASVLFRRGYNPKQVQTWLGHHSAAFTLAVYVHLLPDNLPEPTFWDHLREVETPEGALAEEQAV